MRQDDRAPFTHALRRARESAYAPGEYIEQESFVVASEIRDLAVRAGVGPGVAVLDLCCGVAGPGRFIARELGCDYLGVDGSESALEIAREGAAGLPCRFQVGRVPPLPPGPFDVVLLLETLLAFRDKAPLLEAVAAALAPGGRLVCTLEEGEPLTAAEREQMPDADTVWLTPLGEFEALLMRVGLAVRWREDHTAGHRAMADALGAAFAADADAISAAVGRPALDVLVDSHRLWSAWMASGRVRKFAIVAEKA